MYHINLLVASFKVLVQIEISVRYSYFNVS